MREIFAHGIGRADLLDGMVRLELVTLVPGGSGGPVAEPREVIWLPLEGFLRSAATLDGLRGEMARAGLLPAAGPAAAAAARGSSPNFPTPPDGPSGAGRNPR